MNYIRFMNLVMNARLVLTDSAGIQEECSYLGIPCLTLREKTERPVTIQYGTNPLCDLIQLYPKAKKTLSNSKRIPAQIELWDGHTADRVVAYLETTVGSGIDTTS